MKLVITGVTSGDPKVVARAPGLKKIKYVNPDADDGERFDPLKVVPRKAESVFPEELWLLIFEKLIRPADLKNFYGICRTFQRALRPLIPKFMFETVMPKLFAMLPKKDILSCRLVCKQWCLGVDNFLENHDSRHAYNSKVSMSKLGSPFLNEQILQRKGFSGIKIPDDTRRSWLPPKVVGGAMSFQINFGIGMENFQRRLLYALYYVISRGQSVYQFDFEVVATRPAVSELSCFNALCKLLKYTPNLRHLSISGHVQRGRKIMDFCLLPDLPRLRTLKVLFTQNNLLLEETLVVKYGDRLQKLEIGKWNNNLSHLDTSKALKDLTVYLEPWKKEFQVETLQVQYVQLPSSAVLRGLLLDFGKKSRITKLAVGPIASEECMKHLFRLTNKLPKLECLRIWFGSEYVVAKTATSMRKILDELAANVMAPPKLHTLEVDNSSQYIDYIFLTLFPNIQRLHIRHSCENRVHLIKHLILNYFWQKRRPEIVEVHGHLYQGKMYDSNIWHILPNLKVITFMYPGAIHVGGRVDKPESFSVYTRETYELTRNPGRQSAEI